MGVRFGLSARLLLLTMLFVMLAEVLIYVPSVADYRITWLNDRIASARIAALSLDFASDSGQASPDLGRRLLESIGARQIMIENEGHKRVLAQTNMPLLTGRKIDLTDTARWTRIRDTFSILLFPDPQPMRVMARGMGSSMDRIEVVLDESPLRAAMLDYSRNLLLVSLFISFLTAGLVYITLHRILVRPVHALSANLVAFAKEPDNPARIIVPSDHKCEVGLAERAAQQMQQALNDALKRKQRLADLGLAVSKVNHELRNMLNAAQLMADGLVDEISARRFAPRLVATLDRAIAYCEATLAYGRASEPLPLLKSVALRPLVDEIPQLAGLGSGIAFINQVPEDAILLADREQLGRALVNLVRNSAQALRQVAPVEEGPRILVTTESEAATIRLIVEDNGPGVPERAKQNLFRPFEGSVRPGGTGLGLAICAEIIALHGGSIHLDETQTGARFVMEFPGN